MFLQKLIFSCTAQYNYMMMLNEFWPTICRCKLIRKKNRIVIASLFELSLLIVCTQRSTKRPKINCYTLTTFFPQNFQIKKKFKNIVRSSTFYNIYIRYIIYEEMPNFLVFILEITAFGNINIFKNVDMFNQCFWNPTGARRKYFAATLKSFWKSPHSFVHTWESM